MATEQTISARWVAPVSSPPIADGIVSFDEGRITHIGPHDGRRIDQRFDDAILLPGLVNAHTHLDLTGAKGLTPPQCDFSAWLSSVIAYRLCRTMKQVDYDISDGGAQCENSGTTTVGDVAVDPYQYVGHRTVAFQELIGLSADRGEASVQSWRANGRTPAGLSPHAPFSFRYSLLDGLPASAPLKMHLAESREELELLETHAGPMRQFLERIGAWDESGLPPSLGGIVELLSRRTGPLLLVHCNYLPMDIPIPKNATIVYCPRTHAAFGHPPHPFREFLARGDRVVLGTDSLASNPDLSVLNEARFLFLQFDQAESLLKMITMNAAEALGVGDKVGQLAAGWAADFCVVGVQSNGKNPIHNLFDSDCRVQAVYIGGIRWR